MENMMLNVNGVDCSDLLNFENSAKENSSEFKDVFDEKFRKRHEYLKAGCEPGKFLVYALLENTKNGELIPEGVIVKSETREKAEDIVTERFSNVKGIRFLRILDV